MIAFIPISGWHGDNIMEVSSNLAWFKGFEIGPENDPIICHTLIEAIDAFIPRHDPTKIPLRLPIHGVYKIGGIGTVFTGIVKSGVIRPGMFVNFAPSAVTDEVTSVEMHHKAIPEGKFGNIVSFSVKGTPNEEIQTGYVVSDTENDPAKEVSSFEAQIIVLNHPGEIRFGYTPIVYCHTAHVACKFEELITKIDRYTNKKTEESPQSLKMGDCAIVKLVPTKPFCVEAFVDYAPLGRFVVRDFYKSVAIGIINKVEKIDRSIPKAKDSTKITLDQSDFRTEPL